MIIQKAFRYKLDLTSEQEKMISSWISSCRYLYNSALEHRIRNYEQFRKSINYYDQANDLISVKEAFPFIAEVPSQTLQQKLKDLDSAFMKFFKGGGFPKFKKKGSVDGIRFPDGKNLKVNYRSRKRTSFVKIPKIGDIKFISSRPIEGTIRNATITKTASGFFISIQTQIEFEIGSNFQHPIGIDRGVRTMAMTSDGEAITMPMEDILKLESKLHKEQRRLAKKKKGSENFIKQKKKVAKVYAKITNIKRDNLHKVTTRLANNHGIIVLEDLKTRNMTRSAKGTIGKHGKNVRAKSGLNKAILRNNWHEFETLLAYKLAWRGGVLRKVDPKFTSQVCSICGHCEKENRKSEMFLCLKCGHQDHADVNGAKNILGRDTASKLVETLTSAKTQSRVRKVKSVKQEPLLGN